MNQGSFADTGFVKKPKLPKRQRFLNEMELVVPWPMLIQRIAPHYPVAGSGRRPIVLETMLRIHFMQQWFGYSDPAMEEALHDVPCLRQFAKLDAGCDAMPDESTILKFRHLLEAHPLASALFNDISAMLAERGMILHQGTVVDATLIAAAPSTKNRDRKRDPQMTHSKKGNQYHFGMKAHIGVDVDSGLVHTLQITTAKVADCVMRDSLTHGDENIVLGDRGYTDNDHNLSATRDDCDPVWGMPFKRPSNGMLTQEQTLLNRMLASMRAIVQHPFRVLKCQFGYTKVRYRGLYKNGQQLYLLFALSNLFRARKAIIPAQHNYVY